jgi:C-22 sterol desaturase
MGSLFNNSFLTNTTSTFVPPFLSNTTYTLPKLPTGLTTAFVIIASLLVLEQIVYRHRKGALPGLKWTIPIIGKLADSVSPTLEMYQRQWDMGPLSAISVFHM